MVIFYPSRFDMSAIKKLGMMARFAVLDFGGFIFIGLTRNYESNLENARVVGICGRGFSRSSYLENLDGPRGFG